MLSVSTLRDFVFAKEICFCNIDWKLQSIMQIFWRFFLRALLPWVCHCFLKEIRKVVHLQNEIFHFHKIKFWENDTFSFKGFTQIFFALCNQVTRFHNNNIRILLYSLLFIPLHWWYQFSIYLKIQFHYLNSKQIW